MDKIRKNKEFNKVYTKGKKFNGKYLIIFQSFSKVKRFGVVASKKTGNSVYRSRAKRLIREAIRLNIELFNENKEYILVMKSIFKDKYSEIKYMDIEKDMKSIIKRINNEKNTN